jgi:hypothetical protein
MEEEYDMARRRYVSTEISVDKVVNRIAREFGDSHALRYTWMIPHAEEDATLHGDAEEILGRVLPLRRDVTPDEFEQTLTILADAGLILWDKPNHVVQFPLDSFYKYQSNVSFEKRRNVDIANNYRDCNSNATATQQHFPSLSPSPTPSPSITNARRRQDYSDKFEVFWGIYPRKVNKKGAYNVWKSRMSDGVEPDTLILSATNYAAKCKRVGTEEQYILHAATFLGPQERWKEYLRVHVAESKPLTSNFVPSDGFTFTDEPH